MPAKLDAKLQRELFFKGQIMVLEECAREVINKGWDPASVVVTVFDLTDHALVTSLGVILLDQYHDHLVRLKHQKMRGLCFALPLQQITHDFSLLYPDQANPFLEPPKRGTILFLVCSHGYTIYRRQVENLIE